MIIASLLEREVQTEQDMKLVAGVLANRLNLDMLLQVDATLAYITNKQTGQITNQDKLINSLFNTYKYSGLPPAPIANSGLRAINAALNPQANNYLYYLSDKNNITHFALTVGGLDELFLELSEKKVVFVSKPKISIDGKCKVCFCRDFEGNFIELVEKL